MKKKEKKVRDGKGIGKVERERDIILKDLLGEREHGSGEKEYDHTDTWG